MSRRLPWGREWEESKRFELAIQENSVGDEEIMFGSWHRNGVFGWGRGCFGQLKLKGVLK